MKKNPEKMAELWEKFPRLSTEDEDQIIHDALPQFLFYEKKGKSAWCYCTACRRGEVFTESKYADGIEICRSDVPGKLKHNEIGSCPMCGHKVQYKAEGRGHKNLKVWGNYAVFTAIDGALYVNAVKAKISWYSIEDPLIEIEGYRKYIFSEYGSEAKRFSWTNGFVTMTHINEPIFGSTYMGCNEERYEYTHLYTLINEYAIEETFLKYVPFSYYCNTSPDVQPILFIKAAAQNPKLVEQLYKCGFGYIINEMMHDRKRFDKLINWKSVEIKKALGFNSAEMKYWKSAEKESRVSNKLYAYLLLKKSKEVKSVDECLKIISEDSPELIEKELKIAKKANSTFIKVRNYLNKYYDKSSRYAYAGEWLDCQDMMDKLHYPKESVLRFPKNLEHLHNRLVNEINANSGQIQKDEDKPYDAKIEKQKIELSKLMYSNLLYTTILPQSMQDIRDEGRILDHCVASYAQRHANGNTHIFFIRKNWRPEERWYTVEVSKEGYIRQCYGYKDNRTIKKPESILRFEKEYKLYLDYAFKRISLEEYEEAAKALDENGGYNNDRTDENRITA